VSLALDLICKKNFAFANGTGLAVVGHVLASALFVFKHILCAKAAISVTETSNKDGDDALGTSTTVLISLVFFVLGAAASLISDLVPITYAPVICFSIHLTPDAWATTAEISLTEVVPLNLLTFVSFYSRYLVVAVAVAVIPQTASLLAAGSESYLILY
jgi:hypothetical protein